MTNTDIKIAKYLANSHHDPDAAYNLAHHHERRYETDQARHWYAKALDYGSDKACLRLGTISWVPDPENAAKLFLMGAELGNNECKFCLGVMAADRGSFQEARNWFQQVDIWPLKNHNMKGTYDIVMGRKKYEASREGQLQEALDWIDDFGSGKTQFNHMDDLPQPLRPIMESAIYDVAQDVTRVSYNLSLFARGTDDLPELEDQISQILSEQVRGIFDIEQDIPAHIDDLRATIIVSDQEGNHQEVLDWINDFQHGKTQFTHMGDLPQPLRTQMESALIRRADEIQCSAEDIERFARGSRKVGDLDSKMRLVVQGVERKIFDSERGFRDEIRQAKALKDTTKEKETTTTFSMER